MLFVSYVCKSNNFIYCTQISLLKNLCFYLLLTFVNKYIYILNTILQIKVLLYLIIYMAIFLRFCCGWWCPRGVLVVAGGVLVVCPHIHSRTRSRAHARLLSAAGLSLVNRSFRASLMNAIALIINYLSVPLGMVLQVGMWAKTLITNYL